MSELAYWAPLWVQAPFGARVQRVQRVHRVVVGASNL